MIDIVLFVEPILEIDSILEIILILIDFLRDHNHDLRPHREHLLILRNQIPVKITTTTMKTFQSRKTKLKLICIARKWQKLHLQKVCFVMCISILKRKLIQNYLPIEYRFYFGERCFYFGT